MTAPLPSPSAVRLAGQHIDDYASDIGDAAIDTVLGPFGPSALRTVLRVAAAYAAGSLVERQPPDETAALLELDTFCRDQRWEWRAEANTATDCAYQGTVTVASPDGSLGRASSLSGATVTGCADAASAVRLAAEAALRKLAGT